MTITHDHTLATRTLLGSIMSKSFPAVPDTTRLDELASFLLKHKVTSAAVTDKGGQVIGCISMIDLIRDRYITGETEDDMSARVRTRTGFEGACRSGFHIERTPRTTVRDIMMPSFLQLPETASIDQAAALMAYEGQCCVFVVSGAGTVVGVVTALDVLRWLGNRFGEVQPQSARSRWRDSFEYVT